MLAALEARQRAALAVPPAGLVGRKRGRRLHEATRKPAGLAAAEPETIAHFLEHRRPHASQVRVGAARLLAAATGQATAALPLAEAITIRLGARGGRRAAAEAQEAHDGQAEQPHGTRPPSNAPVERRQRHGGIVASGPGRGYGLPMARIGSAATARNGGFHAPRVWLLVGGVLIAACGGATTATDERGRPSSGSGPAGGSSTGSGELGSVDDGTCRARWEELTFNRQDQARQWQEPQIGFADDCSGAEVFTAQGQAGMEESAADIELRVVFAGDEVQEVTSTVSFGFARSDADFDLQSAQLVDEGRGRRAFLIRGSVELPSLGGGSSPGEVAIRASGVACAQPSGC